jgi:hypothetical protein
MRALTIIGAIGVTLLGSSGAQEPTAELAAARMMLLAEPKFEAKPRYLAIALGRPVTRVVWCVLDGTSLYVDRNGDGLLDAAKERLVPRVEKLKDHFIAEVHEYTVGELAAVEASPAYPSLTLSLKTWNLDYKAAEDLQEVMAVLRADPSRRNPTIRLKRSGKPDQLAMTEFSDARETATVLHFDGPTTWGLVENLRPQRLTAGKEHDLQVAVGTPGLGAWSLTITTTGERKDLRPEIDAAFAGGTKQHWVLPEWC